ncbi:MAG: putative phosphohydrolase, partial [Verrucomicrobiaceae bacterium]|nr:putative phosphohydrolase [Verrucomicrobiaceae bacterium]
NWSDIPATHWAFIEATQLVFETNTHFFVHANVMPQVALEKQAANVVLWERFGGDEIPHCSGKTMVCGHTSQHSGKPRNIGHAVCIDTWVYGNGWLTCLDVATGRYWQADQEGNFRERMLEQP